MLARMVCSSIGNASLSLPALPQRWLCFPARSQDFSCCSLLGSHPVGKGEHRSEGCPAATGGWQGQGPQPGHCEEQWQAFSNKPVKKASFFFFSQSRKKCQESWRSSYYGMASLPSVATAIQHQQPTQGSVAARVRHRCSLPLQPGPPPAFLSLFPRERGAGRGPQSLPWAKGILGSCDACGKDWRGREDAWGWHRHSSRLWGQLWSGG